MCRNLVDLLCFIARRVPTTLYSIWEARKWRNASAQTQNLRHRDQIWWRRALLIAARLIEIYFYFCMICES